MKRSGKKLIQFVVPLAVLLLAVVAAVYMIATREKPKRSKPEHQGALVNTETVQRERFELRVRAQGTVIPAKVITVYPQVSGKLVEVNDALIPGGRLQKGDLLVQIDPSDYLVAVQERRTALEQAQAQLKLEKGQQQVAEREWRLFADEFPSGQGDSSLALRKPQLESAEAAVRAAQARLERAELDLQRTRLEAPFDSFVRSESVDIGQFVNPQTPVATIVGTEAFWVQVSLPVEKLPFITIPQAEGEPGAKALVSYDAGITRVQREGRVIRLFGDLDPAGRMARLLVEVPNPFGGGSGEEPTMPLFVDSYVDVEILSDREEELIAVPRSALRDGNHVYLVGPENRLQVRDVSIYWRRPDTVLVSKGLEDGDTIFMTSIPTPVEGMKLRVQPPSSETSGRTDEARPRPTSE